MELRVDMPSTNLTEVKVNWYYKCVGRDKDYQFELYPVGASRNKKEAVVANVWNYDPTWKVNGMKTVLTEEK